MRAGLVVVLAFSASAPAVMLARPAVDITQFELDRRRAVVVPVMVNGAGPFSFLLDTGSSHSVVSEDLALRVGAQVVATAIVVSPTGEKSRAVVKLDGVTLGPVRTSGVLASVAPARAFEIASVQGIIGQDILASECFTLDFRKRRVEWHQSPMATPKSGSVLSLGLDRGLFVVALPQGSSTLTLVPDSGTDGVVLFARRERSLPLMMRAVGSARLETLTARRHVAEVSISRLLIGSVTLRDIRAVLVRDDGEGASLAGDGLLPLHLFERVTLDGPQRLMIIE